MEKPARKANEVKLLIRADKKKFTKGLPEKTLQTLVCALLEKAGYGEAMELLVNMDSHGITSEYNWIDVREVVSCPSAILLKIHVAGSDTIWTCALKIPSSQKATTAFFRKRLAGAARAMKEESAKLVVPKPQKKSEPRRRSTDVPSSFERRLPETEGVVVAKVEAAPAGAAPQEDTAVEQPQKRVRRQRIAKVFTEDVVLDFIMRFVKEARGENRNITSVALSVLLANMGIDAEQIHVMKFLKEREIITTAKQCRLPSLVMLTPAAKMKYKAMLDFKSPVNRDDIIASLQEESKVLKREQARIQAKLAKVEQQAEESEALLKSVHDNFKEEALTLRRILKLEKDEEKNRAELKVLYAKLGTCDVERSAIFKTLLKRFRD